MSLVSVIMPAYNCEKTITKAIESIFNQESSLIKEVLVYEDCSSDNTLFVLRDLAKKFPKISLIVSNENLGAGKARNLLLRKATGNILLLLIQMISGIQ